jgi:hypothetical protein
MKFLVSLWDGHDAMIMLAVYSLFCTGSNGPGTQARSADKMLLQPMISRSTIIVSKTAQLTPLHLQLRFRLLSGYFYYDWGA